MARTIEFEGRLIEVPDDATDDEVATIISATPGPATTPPRTAMQDFPSETYDRSRPSAPQTTQQNATPDPLSTGISGFFTQLGVHPSQWAELAASHNPREQLRRSTTAMSEGRLSEGFNRLVQSIPGSGLVVPLAERLLSDPYEQIQKGEAETSPSKRFGYAASALLPVFGPQAAEIGEEMGTDPARATGRAAGLLASLLAGGMRTSERPAGYTPTEIRKTYAERTGKLGVVEELVEGSLVGSSAYRQFRLAALDDARRIATDTANRISNFRGTPEQLGREIQSANAAARGSIARQVRKIENEVNSVAIPKRQRMRVRDKEGAVLPPDPNKPGTAGREFTNPKHAGETGAVANPATGAWVDIAPWKRYLDDLRKVADDPHRTFTEAERSNLATITAELKSAPRMLPWDTALRTADAIRKYVRADTDIAPSLVGDTAVRMTRTLDSSLESALTTAGGPELATKWRSAQKLRADAHAAYIDGVLGTIQKTKPEAIPRLLTDRSTSIDDVRVIRQRLGAVQTRAAVAENFRDAIRESTTQIHEGGVVRDVIDPRVLANRLEAQWGDGKLSVALDDSTIETAITDLTGEIRALKQPRGIDLNTMDPGNRMMDLAQVMRGRITPGIAGQGLGLTAAHKFLLSPDPWTAMRLAIRNSAAGAGTAGTVLGATTARDKSVDRDKRHAALPPQRGSIQ